MAYVFITQDQDMDIRTCEVFLSREGATELMDEWIDENEIDLSDPDIEHYISCDSNGEYISSIITDENKACIFEREMIE